MKYFFLFLFVTACSHAPKPSVPEDKTEEIPVVSGQPFETPIKIASFKALCHGDQLCTVYQDVRDDGYESIGPILGINPEWGYEYEVKVRMKAVASENKSSSDDEESRESDSPPPRYAYEVVEVLKKSDFLSRACFQFMTYDSLKNFDAERSESFLTHLFEPKKIALEESFKKGIQTNLEKRKFPSVVELCLGDKPEEPLVVKRILESESKRN